LLDEIQRLRETEVRLSNETETHRTQHQAALGKTEREVKQRVDAEVRMLEKLRWADALEEDLEKERVQCMKAQHLLQEASADRETIQVEVDKLRVDVKALEAKETVFKQTALEAAQQRQRHENQVNQYKQSNERDKAKIQELKDQLETETELTKKATEQCAGYQRDLRQWKTHAEDVSHANKELIAERDLLREKIERFDDELGKLTEERRTMQKEINDLSMTYRTNQIELKRKTDQLDRLERKHEKLHADHVTLLDAHRSITAEAENLRDDVVHLDEQVKRESDFRKQLQSEKKQVAGQLQTTQVERDTNKLAVVGSQKELKESVEKIVNLESVVRDTKQAMQKLMLEHSVELKSHAQKITMLEKVVADERKERRNLVTETQDVVTKREESLAKLAEKVREIQNLKRTRLEKEEEVDRLKILLKAQEQRNLEQLVTVDKYQASVANHEAEMRQMQVLLQCEREEGRRQLQEMEVIQTAARQTMEHRVEQWKMCFEDVFSRMNFNPLTSKLQNLEKTIEELQDEKAEIADVVVAQKQEFRNIEEDVTIRDERIKALEEDCAEAKREAKLWMTRQAEALLSYNREGMSRADLEGQVKKQQSETEVLEDMRAHFEAEIEEARKESVVAFKSLWWKHVMLLPRLHSR
jgi:hypothetical protein